MPKETISDLQKFLEPFPKKIQEIVFWLRDFVWDLYPDCNELIYDNYNAVAFGWSTSDKQGGTFCTIAVGRTTKNVHFGFYYGAVLHDPDKVLIGEGNQYRYILVKNVEGFPKTYMERLLEEAYFNSMAKLKGEQEVKGLTIMKSISAKKRT